MARLAIGRQHSARSGRREERLLPSTSSLALPIPHLYARSEVRRLNLHRRALFIDRLWLLNIARKPSAGTYTSSLRTISLRAMRPIVQVRVLARLGLTRWQELSHQSQD